MADPEEKIQATVEDEEQGEAYEYSIIPAAIETLLNVLLRYGIDLGMNHYNLGDTVVFSSKRLLDMKSLKKQKIISSYTIMKISQTKLVIEEG